MQTVRFTLEFTFKATVVWNYISIVTVFIPKNFSISTHRVAPMLISIEIPALSIAFMTFLSYA